MKRDKSKRIIVTVLTAVWMGIFLSGCAAEKKDDPQEGEIILDSVSDTENLADASPHSDTETDEQTDPQDPAPSADETTPNESGQLMEDNSQTATTPGNLYEQFLRNEAAALAAESIPKEEYRRPILEQGGSYTFAELGETISAYFLDPEYTDRTSYTDAQYAYVNSPDSTGAQLLLVKFIGLNIYSQDDDSYAVVVIKEENGQLYLTAEYECWARSETLAYSNGIINDYGSAGAGDHYSGISAFQSDGTVLSVCGTETLSGWWTSRINDAAYQEIFGENTEPGEFVVAIHTVGEDRYYQYDTEECTEEQKILCEAYVERCREEQEINWVSGEEVLNAVKARCDGLGIAYDTINQNPEILWNSVE